MGSYSSDSAGYSPPSATRPSSSSTSAPHSSHPYHYQQPYDASSRDPRYESGRGDPSWHHPTPHHSDTGYTAPSHVCDPSIISEIVRQVITKVSQEITALSNRTHQLEQINAALFRRVADLEQELSSRNVSWHEQNPTQPSATQSQPSAPSQNRHPPPPAVDHGTPRYDASPQRRETNSYWANSSPPDSAHRFRGPEDEASQSYLDNLSSVARQRDGVEAPRSHMVGSTGFAHGLVSDAPERPGVSSGITESNSGRGWGKTGWALGGAAALGGLVLLNQYANDGAYSTAALNGGREVLNMAGTATANLWREAASGARSLVGDTAADTLANCASAAGTGLSTACSWIPFGAKLNGAVTAAGALASNGGVGRAARAGASTMAKQTVLSKAMGGLGSYFGASNGDPTPTQDAGGSWMSYLPGWGGASNAKPASPGWFASSRPASQAWFGMGKAAQPSNPGWLSSWWSKPEPAQSSWFGSFGNASTKPESSGWLGGMASKAGADSSAAASRRTGWWG